MTLRLTRALLISMFGVVGVVLGAAAPAYAYPVTPFYNCYNGAGACSYAYTEGSIVWYNRTAGIQGHVVDVGTGSTTAVFEAFAGSTKIDSTTRTANDETSLGGDRSFNFTIGDTDLVGGIDRIKVTVCVTEPNGARDCGTPLNFSRP